jgi:hypothetical protein
MHFMLARHYCGGQLAEASVTFGAEVSTCGMEKCNPETGIPMLSFTNNCCQNHYLIFALNDFNNVSSPEADIPGVKILQITAVPGKPVAGHQRYLNLSESNLRPPGENNPDRHSCPVLRKFNL